jgi:hypothetical protein
MKASHVLSLIQKSYTTVGVSYKAEDDRAYTFKALLSENLKEGDLVIIPSNYGFMYQVGIVRTVHKEPQIDTSASYDYKWIVGKLDITRYTSTLALEERFKEAMATLERKRTAQIALQEFTSAFPADSTELADLKAILGEFENAQIA